MPLLRLLLFVGRRIIRSAGDMLKGYFAAQKKKVYKFFWPDLIPIVQSFFTSLWNQERPKVWPSSQPPKQYTTPVTVWVFYASSDRLL